MNDLNHSGILGMKWGKRNGPPYPLSYSKLSADEKQAAKESAIRRGDIKEVSANRDHYSNSEISAAIDRFNLNTRLNDLTSPKNRSKLKKGIVAVDSLSNSLGKMANLVQNGSRLYNSAAPVLNTFTGTTLKPIRFDDGNDKKKK